MSKEKITALLTTIDDFDSNWIQQVIFTNTAIRVVLENEDQNTLDQMKGIAQNLLVDHFADHDVTIITALKEVTPKKAPSPKLKLDHIDRIVVVASGKGGVGKSTVASALALYAQSTGLKVGILDADIYGPSQPTLFACQDAKPERVEGKILPIDVDGIKVMSMGFMVDQSQPIIWRGPMVQTAMRQFFEDVAWGDLDLLVVDMPPGTGDAQLTLAQKIDVDGAIIVSTPQDLALMDARKGLEMFRTTGVPVLGLIENMAVFTCPHCSEHSYIYGDQTLVEEAKKLQCNYLGALPLDMKIRTAADAGTMKSVLSVFEKVFRVIF